MGKGELVWKAGYGPAMLNMALSDERESDGKKVRVYEERSRRVTNILLMSMEMH